MSKSFVIFNEFSMSLLQQLMRKDLKLSSQGRAAQRICREWQPL